MPLPETGRHDNTFGAEEKDVISLEDIKRVKSVTYHVAYQLVGTFKLISKYSLANPLREITSGQEFVAPIIEDVDQIYVLDVSEAQSVNTGKEADGLSCMPKNETVHRMQPSLDSWLESQDC